jgi:hypothetical protein
MKLARIAKPLGSLQVPVTLTGDLNAALESYARYYEHLHGDAVDSKALIPEILSASYKPTVSSSRGRALALTVCSATPDSSFNQWQHQGTTVTAFTAKPDAVLRTCLHLIRHSSPG